MTEDDPRPSPAETGRPAPPGWAAVVISGLALVVAVAGAFISIRIANTASAQAKTAKDVFANTLTQQRVALARKVSVTLDAATGNRTLSVANSGTLPVHYVSVYLADSDGSPAVQYTIYDPLPGCTAIAFTSDDSLPQDLVVTFRDANDISWLLSAGTGGLKRAPETVGVPADFRDWSEKVSRVANCS